MSKKREEKSDPLLGDLLEGILQYKEAPSPEILQDIAHAIDQGANSLKNLFDRNCRDNYSIIKITRWKTRSIYRVFFACRSKQ